MKALKWVHTNLFRTPLDAVLTLAIIGIFVWAIPPAVNWLFLKAVWGVQPVAACDAVRGSGACWAVVAEKFRVMMFGVYPFDEQWRPALATILMIALIVGSAFKRHWRRELAAVWVGGIVLILWLMGGGLGLTSIPTAQWGGLPITLMLSIVGVAGAFPLGVVLALGRRSELPIVRAISVVYIEVIRGVPLITVLFMASTMFALFLPEEFLIDQLLRAQVAIILFMAAYLAEAVRGGLQALPSGQTEAAQALGLSYWQAMGLIVLPQALRISIPSIVNSFISTFKDTSLVTIIALFDFSYAVKKSVETDFVWKKYFVEAFIFAIVVYWVFCFAMSKYSQWLERDLSRARSRSAAH